MTRHYSDITPIEASGTASRMAHSLFDAGIDVSDERDVILHLVGSGFLSAEINQHMDAAVDLVRSFRATSPLLDVA